MNNVCNSPSDDDVKKIVPDSLYTFINRHLVGDNSETEDETEF